MKKFIFISLGIILVIIFVNLVKPQESEISGDETMPTSSPSSLWHPYSSNPIILLEQEKPGAMWNDPSVIKVGSQYVMYLTTSQTAGQDNISVYRAISADGINWDIKTELILIPGNGGSFDEKKVETPSVIFFDGKYHMYYTGISDAGLIGFSIGHAISLDGINWSKVGNEPVLSPSGKFTDWNGFQVAEPGAVVFKNKIYLYFAAVGTIGDGTKPPFVKRSIGLAISDDGMTFENPQKVMGQSALYPSENGFQGYSTPAATFYNGRLHLLYDVFQYRKGEKPEEHLQVALHHAISSDGIKWVEDSAPIFTRENFPWTRREIRSPSILYDNQELKMWFAGDDLIAKKLWGIGYATMSDAKF